MTDDQEVAPWVTQMFMKTEKENKQKVAFKTTSYSEGIVRLAKIVN